MGHSNSTQKKAVACGQSTAFKEHHLDSSDCDYSWGLHGLPYYCEQIYIYSLYLLPFYPKPETMRIIIFQFGSQLG